MLIVILAFLLLIVSVFLILLILIQQGKGGGLAGAFGGMGGQSAFGTKAGDLFTRITIVVATIWIVLCVATVKLSSVSDQSRFGNDLGRNSDEDQAKGIGPKNNPKSNDDATGASTKPLPDSKGGATGADSKATVPPAAPVPESRKELPPVNE